MDDAEYNSPPCFIRAMKSLIASSLFCLSNNSATGQPIAFAIFSIVDIRKSFFSLSKRETETLFIPIRSARSCCVTPYLLRTSLNLIIRNTLHCYFLAKIRIIFEM
nr:MAG TPA: hypothetical protein [Caudoviricetes sp.]DAV75351.1 MAG TPA: hypothetical protein [Caudoviricetes sp.]